MTPSLPISQETTRWLTLTPAARILGVHATTLRRWADDGEVRCLRTPGGHRRFLEEDLGAFVSAREQPVSSEISETFLQNVLLHTRQEMSLAKASVQPWYATFDETSRAERQESGRHLLGLALKYTLRTTGREPVVKEGRRIGWEYGQDAAQRGLSITETVRAFFFFRETFIRSARPGISTRGRYDAEEVHIHHSLREFLDHVFFAALEGYEHGLERLPDGSPT